MKKIVEWIKDLPEMIFRRGELALKGKALKICRDHLEDCRKERSLLTEMNERLITGDSVQLTQLERKMALSAIEFKPFRAAVEDPKTKRYVRDTWRGTREKIKVCLKES